MFGPARPLRGGGNFNTPLEEEIHELREAQEIQHQEYENQVNFWFFRIEHLWVEIWRWTTICYMYAQMINFGRWTSGSISANSWTLDVQTSLGVSFWKCCLSLQLFFHWMIFDDLFLVHQMLRFQDFRLIPSKILYFGAKSFNIEDFDGKSRNLRSLRLFFQNLEPLMVLVLPVKS